MAKRFVCFVLSAAITASAVPFAFAEKAEQENTTVIEIAEGKINVTYGDGAFSVKDFEEIELVSSDTSIIEIGEDGLIYPIGVGEATLSPKLNEAEEAADVITVTVSPRQAEFVSPEVFDKVFDGETTALFTAETIALENAVEGDDVYISTEDAAAEFAAAEVGEDIEVKISGLKLAGADSGKYTLAEDTADAKANISTEISAEQIAAKITAIHQPKGADKLQLPKLPEGFEISVDSTSDSRVIAEDLSVMAHAEDKEIELVLTVSEIEKPQEDTDEIIPDEEQDSENGEENPDGETDTENSEPTEGETEGEAKAKTGEENQEQVNSAKTEPITVKVISSDEAVITVLAENGTVEGAGAYPFGESVTLTATADEGYVFAGWSVAGEHLGYEPSYTFTADRVMTVQAEFIEKDSRKVNITVETVGGSGTVTGAGEYSFGDTVTLKANGRLSYWSVDGVKISQSNPYVFTATEDVTVKAHFSRGGGSLDNNYQYFTIKFVSNGGTNVDDIEIARNTVAKAPEEPTRSGYKFTGWYTDEDLKNKYTFTERVLADLTLYAGWEKTAVSEEEILPFADVKSSAWYYNAVEYVYNNKLMQGMTKTTFEPETTLTRAMFVTILHRAKGTPEAGEKSDFADVADGTWYKDAVDWALEEGIAVGYDEETFAPNDTITREQMASMLFRYVKKAGYDMSGSADLSEFTDKEKISDWALEAVKWAIDNGIINGMTADEIAPQGIATRAQCAQILMQARKNLNLMGSDE